MALASSHASAQKLKQAVAGPFLNCTADQKAAIETAAGEAGVRIWRTKADYSGVGPATDDRQVYQLAIKKRRAAQLEDTIFGRNDTDIGYYITNMYEILSASKRDIRCAPNTDKDCGATLKAYVRSSERNIIWVCPNFFQNDPKTKAPIDISAQAADQRVRTLVHESAHSAGISESAAGESYCTFITCEASCGTGGGPGKGTNVADNWSAFVHCVSGQAPDELD